MTKQILINVILIILGLSVAYAENQFPQKPKDLPATDNHFNKYIREYLEKYGTQYCTFFENISNPEYEYDNEITLSLTICDNKNRYIGFSNIANTNEQFITNIYSLSEAAQTLADLTGDIMVYELSENIDSFQLLLFRPAVLRIYGIQERSIQWYRLGYENWAEDINNYYRNL